MAKPIEKIVVIDTQCVEALKAIDAISSMSLPYFAVDGLSPLELVRAKVVAALAQRREWAPTVETPKSAREDLEGRIKSLSAKVLNTVFACLGVQEEVRSLTEEELGSIVVAMESSVANSVGFPPSVIDAIFASRIALQNENNDPTSREE